MKKEEEVCDPNELISLSSNDIINNLITQVKVTQLSLTQNSIRNHRYLVIISIISLLSSTTSKQAKYTCSTAHQI